MLVCLSEIKLYALCMCMTLFSGQMMRRICMICLYYLRVSGVDLEQEYDPAGLLGFTLEHNNKNWID